MTKLRQMLHWLDFLAEGGLTATVNIGTGVGSSVREVPAAASTVAGRPVPAEDAPRRPGDPVALFADATLARQLFGWEAHHDLTEIVASAWRWHESHPEGYGSATSTGAARSA